MPYRSTLLSVFFNNLFTGRRYFTFDKFFRRFENNSPQNIKASFTESHLPNLSSNSAVFLSWPQAITSLVMESRIIISASVAPEPVHASVAPFLKRLMPNPTGTTVVITLKPGLLGFRPTIAVRTRMTSGPGLIPR